MGLIFSSQPKYPIITIERRGGRTIMIMQFDPNHAQNENIRPARNFNIQALTPSGEEKKHTPERKYRGT